MKKKKKTDTSLPSLVPPTPSELAELREKAALYDKHLSGYQDLQRIRNEQALTLEDYRQYVRDVLLQVLEIEDDFERAIEYAVIGKNFDAVLAGLRPISDKMIHFLKSHGVTPIEPVGAKFNPTRHQSLDPLPSLDFDKMIVTKQLRVGWLLGDKVLRKSIVEVTLADDVSNDGAKQPKK